MGTDFMAFPKLVFSRAADAAACCK
jgi:hypothetical protein